MRQNDLELLRSLWTSYSFVESEDCRQSLKVWLSDGNYYLNNSAPNLSLYCLISDEVKRSYSLDAFRFATHAVQTVHEMEKTSAYDKLTSWRIIQAYYAAYFAAHATLRYFGRSFSHLESGHVCFLRDRCASEAGYSPTLPVSYYLINFDPSTRILGFNKYGESHRDLWKCYQSLVTELGMRSLTVRASEQRRQELSAFFSDISDAITNRGQYSSGNWLSVVRNEVNYKSLEGAWFPFSRSTPSFSALKAKVRDWRRGNSVLGRPTSAKNELERFFLTAFSVVDLGLSISMDYQTLASQAGRRSSSFSRLIKLSAAA